MEARRPTDLNQAIRLCLQFIGIGAVRAVNGHARVFRDKAEDPIARHRGTTLRQLGREVRLAFHQDARAISPSHLWRVRDPRCPLGGRHHHVIGIIILRVLLHQEFGHMLGGDLAPADGRVESIQIRFAQLRGDIAQCFLGKEALHAQPTSADAGGQQVAALVSCFFSTLLREPLTDLGFSPRGLYEVDPVLGRASMLILRGEDLDLIAGLQRGFQRDELAVHLGSDATVANLRMDCIGKVHGG